MRKAPEKRTRIRMRRSRVAEGEWLQFVQFWNELELGLGLKLGFEEGFLLVVGLEREEGEEEEEDGAIAVKGRR